MATLCSPLHEQDLNSDPNKNSLQEKVEPVVQKHVTASGSNVQYFRNLLVEEKSRLLNLCDIWKNIQDGIELIEDADAILGDIRTVIGQAHLIMKERFSQFEGLVNNCEFNTSEKTVTCKDLQGFWEMIYFQVEDVDKKFKKLEMLKENNWKAAASDVPRVVKKRVNKKSKNLRKQAGVNPSAIAKREDAKKRLAAVKFALKKDNPASITFDAGFFKVNSPAHSATKMSRTPREKSSKPPKTPTSANFMHGRYIHNAIGVDTPVSKKVLSFDDNDSKGH